MFETPEWDALNKQLALGKRISKVLLDDILNRDDPEVIGNEILAALKKYRRRKNPPTASQVADEVFERLTNPS